MHLIPLIHDFGHVASLAALLVMLIGPMQLVGRLLEGTWAHRVTPQLLEKLTFASPPAVMDRTARISELSHD